MVFVARYFHSVGDLKLAMVNFVPLFLAFLLFMRPSAFLTAVNDGVKVVAGIIIQHPFYASIIGILSASGLAVAFADAFGRFASAVWSFISGLKLDDVMGYIVLILSVLGIIFADSVSKPTHHPGSPAVQRRSLAG